MRMQGSIAMVTGANRGLGHAFVEALLTQGASRIYATARDESALAALRALSPDRVKPLRVDITNEGDVLRVAKEAGDVNLLIHNAGTLRSGSLLQSSVSSIREDFETNFYGVLSLSRAFAPVLEKNSGAVVNILSVVSLSSMSGLGGYSASKAAAWSMTQALRAEWRARGIAVHNVYPGPIDTDMIRAFQMPKTSPQEVAHAVLEGLERNVEDIFPDLASRQFAEVWLRDPKGLEKLFSSI
jgi:NAD(P)-dependent dehydrogenase (short-subunit alcohol dehydrogenase family)